MTPTKIICAKKSIDQICFWLKPLDFIQSKIWFLSPAMIGFLFINLTTITRIISKIGMPTIVISKINFNKLPPEIISAISPKTKPKSSLPELPRKALAGLKLKIKKIIAAAAIANEIKPTNCRLSRLAIKKNPIALTTARLVQIPSMPSIKFTETIVPT